MKKKLLVAFMFYSFMTFSQSKEKIYLINENEKVSKQQFEALDKEKIYFTKIKNDSSIISIANSRQKIIQLNPSQQSQISLYLDKIIGVNYDSTKKTMIHLYRKNQKIGNDSEYKRYWSWIESNSNKYQAFLLGSKNSKIVENSKKHIFLDNDGLFENSFFSKSDFEINHILIKPSGEVYVFYGMEDILNVLDKSVD